MRTIAIKIMLLVGLAWAMQSCYYENPPEPLPIDPEDVSFNTHILPVLVKTCALEECHNGTHAPDLRAESAYQELRKGGYYNVTFPEQSRLYQSINYSGGLPMPPAGQLSPLDRDLILIWITKGAPND